MVDATNGVRPEAPTGASPAFRPAARPATTAGPSFDTVLAAMEESQITFSRHATRRIEQRGLQLDGDRMRRLEQAVDRAQDKGSRDSLILLDELALVVSVRDHIVVTAMDGAGSKEHVFTNIDSVVIAD